MKHLLLLLVLGSALPVLADDSTSLYLRWQEQRLTSERFSLQSRLPVTDEQAIHDISKKQAADRELAAIYLTGALDPKFTQFLLSSLMGQAKDNPADTSLQLQLLIAAQNSQIIALLQQIAKK